MSSLWITYCVVVILWKDLSPPTKALGSLSDSNAAFQKDFVMASISQIAAIYEVYLLCLMVSSLLQLLLMVLKAPAIHYYLSLFYQQKQKKKVD